MLAFLREGCGCGGSREGWCLVKRDCKTPLLGARWRTSLLNQDTAVEAGLRHSISSCLAYSSILGLLVLDSPLKATLVKSRSRCLDTHTV